MDNTETLATPGTHDTGQRQTKHKNSKQHRKLKTMTLTENGGESMYS
jgi:hypothetical protein